MKTVLTLSFFMMAWIGTITAQTKLISHKSHSGSNENFKIALDHNLFDLGASNFGMAPRPEVNYSKLDSVIFVNDSVAVMWTSSFCSWRRSEDTTKWMPGGGYVYHHPLFSLQHSLDSIKKVLDEEYNFKNPADSVVFVGYDNIKPEKKITPIQQVPVEIPMIEPVEVSPSKKEMRKAKRALKRQKKKERKAKKRIKKQLEKQPVIKPAVFIPVKNDDPKDPPGFANPLKILLIGIVGLLAILTGFIAKRFASFKWSAQVIE